MKVSLLAVGKGMPGWIEAGFQQYRERLPLEWNFKLTEIDAEKRAKNQSVINVLYKEGNRMLDKISTNSFVIALDEQGELWDTLTLSQKMKDWLQNQTHLSFLIGGADGYSKDCLSRANVCWSLSRLTFPHLLVRVLVVEQLYRAMTLLTGHPYHRGRAA